VRHPVGGIVLVVLVGVATALFWARFSGGPAPTAPERAPKPGPPAQLDLTRFATDEREGTAVVTGPWG
jgi:hypothetical protein